MSLYEVQLKKIQPQLKAFVRSKIYNEADVSDLVQIVNEVALNKAHLFDASKNFEAWTIGIAKYQIKSYLKKYKKRPDILSLDVPEGEGYVVEENPTLWLQDIPFADIVEEERRELTDKIRSVLTKKQKMVFDLCVEGLTPAGIALRLNIPRRTVYILRYRMIKRAQNFIRQLQNINNYDYNNPK